MSEMSNILVDWGTSNLRLWAVDAQGKILSERRSDKGMSKLKPHEFEPVLNALLTDVNANPDTPVLMCGMVGAAQGWQEAPYVTAPTKLDELSNSAIRITGQSRDIRIIPGISQCDETAPDVMRGEETLLLGLGATDGQILMPGTHAKWVHMQNGTVAKFRTIMTGEIFALIEHHSILSRTLIDTAWDDEIFAKAVQDGFDQPGAIVSQFFSLRAAPLLFGQDVAHSGKAKLSGWLIGAEIANSYDAQNGPLTLLSDGQLASLYQEAFAALNIDYTSADASSAAQNGLLKVAQQIWPADA